MNSGNDNQKNPAAVAMENRAVIRKLSEETNTFRRLCELHGLKVANRTLKADVERLRKGMEENQRKLVDLLMKLEDFEGAYQAVQEGLRSMEKTRSPIRKD